MNTEKPLDYLVLVNRLHPLPEGWNRALETVTLTNSMGSAFRVERRACEAWQRLKADLEQNDGIRVDLDSAHRSVAEQQEIMDLIIRDCGAEYAARTVAIPGFSEHHTGLALDVYLIVDGEPMYYNRELPQYFPCWERLHAKLAGHGFILRYPKGREHITGYGYEPWHIRYVGDTDVARAIMACPGMTLEVWLGALRDTNPALDFGSSALYTREDLEAAAVQVKCKFATFAGCELHALRYAGDACNRAENLRWLNGLDAGGRCVQVACFVSDFHSPADGGDTWASDAEYTDWPWWLAREPGGDWKLLAWGPQARDGRRVAP